MNERLIDRYLKINISEADQSFIISHNEVGIYGQVIGVTYHDSNLGNGKVAFFICPGCGNARRDLYLKENEWKCYKCHDLVYYSQQRSRNTYWYWVNRAEKEARKVDSSFRVKDFNDFMNHRWIFPFKPKYMQWGKYENIRFWYDMYMFRAVDELYNLMAPARRFIDRTKKNAPVVEKKLQELIKEQKNSGK